MARPEMVRSETPTLALGLLAFCGGVVILLVAAALGFHFGSDPSIIADIAKAQRIAVPAVVAVVTGVIALAGRRRSWAFAVACVGAAAAVVAGLLAIVLPGG